LIGIIGPFCSLLFLAVAALSWYIGAILRIGDDVKANLINNQLRPGDLKKKGDEKGKSTLIKEGLGKVAAGITTLDEVKRVTSNLG